MSDIFRLNPNLPVGFRVPGVYTSASLTDPGATTPANTALIWGYVGPGAPCTPNAPFLGLSQLDVNQQAAGEGYMLAQAYAAARAQAPYGAEIWCLPLEAPAGGTAATHIMKFMASPTVDAGGKLIDGTGTTALTTHLCTIYCGARRIASFTVKKLDTFETVATNALAEITKVAAALEVVVTRAGAVLTATDRHKGEHGNFVGFRVDFNDPAGGVACSPGTALVDNGPAGADGTATLITHTLNAQATIPNNTSDADASKLIRDKINAEGLPVYASVPGTADGNMVLYYRTGRWVRQLSTAVSAGLNPQTFAVTAGTAGAGVPDIAAALTKLTGDTLAYKAWAPFWVDSTTWGTVSTHIEGQAISPIEKMQMVFGGFTSTLAALGNFADSTTPKLNISARYGLGWYQGSPLHPWQIAARLAAMVAVSERDSWNFNFTPLRGTISCPVAAAPKADRPDLDVVNTAIVSYGLAPIVVSAAGEPELLSSRSTYKSVGFNDAKLEKWSCQLTLDYYRTDIRVYLFKLFGKNKKLKTRSPARTAKSATLEGVKAAVFRRVVSWDDQDLYDGSAQSRDAIMAGVLLHPSRVDVSLPMIPPADLDQISVAGEVQ